MLNRGAPMRNTTSLGWSAGSGDAYSPRMCASTPEELETLLEDASVMTDVRALGALFEEGAVVVADGLEARGREAIAGFIASLWGRRLILAEPRLVVQVRDLALVASGPSISVMRRGNDGAWRYLIRHVSEAGGSEEER